MKINNWLEKASVFYTELDSEILNSKSVTIPYYGYSVIDGPIVENAEILFVGINPGKGNSCHKTELKGSRISYVDPLYPSDYYKYPLAQTTHDYLINAGITKNKLRPFLENDCMKTNYYHIATEKGSDVFPLMNCLGKGRSRKYWTFCAEMLLDLFTHVKPKIIIFEGKEAYDHIIEGCCNALNTWDKSTNMGYFYIEDKNVHCLGYARQYSNIKSNKLAFSEKLKSLLA